MWPAIIAGAASLVGQERANEANTNLNRENRAWTEEMSNSAHQREVVDLRKAGLNPILSAGGTGATTPSAGQTEIKNSISPAVATAMQIQMQAKELEQKDAQISNISADTKNKILTDALINNQISSTSQDVRTKQLSNELTHQSFKYLLEKNKKDSRTDPENNTKGYIRSLMDAPKTIFDEFKGSNKQFKKDNPSLP